MIDKIKKISKKQISGLFKAVGAISAPIRFLVMGYTFFIMIIAGTYFVFAVVMLCFGMAKLADLLALLNAMMSIQAIGAAAFIAKAFIDRDGNGISDHLEDDENGAKRRKTEKE